MEKRMRQREFAKKLEYFQNNTTPGQDLYDGMNNDDSLILGEHQHNQHDNYLNHLTPQNNVGSHPESYDLTPHPPITYKVDIEFDIDSEAECNFSVKEILRS